MEQIWEEISMDFITRLPKSKGYDTILFIVDRLRNQLGSTLMNDLQDQEKELKQYILQLENAEAARDSLLSHLKDALLEQGSRQEMVRTQLLGAREQIDRAVCVRKRLNPAAEDTRVLEQNAPSAQFNSTSAQPPFSQPLLSFAPLKTTEEDNKKAAAAAVAAKLAASTSSAQMLTSILSSLVAEEAASMNGSSKPTGFTSGLPMFNPEKRPKLEKPLPDVSNSDAGGSSFFAPSSQPSMANMPLAPSLNLQAMSQPSQLQTAFAPAPPPPPPPPPSHSPANQYVQSTGLMIGGIPYGYGSNNLPPPPPPPLPPHVAAGLSRPNTQPSQQSQAQQAQQQQQSATGGFFRPPGVGFYGQSHPSTPPVHRQ
ncbi:formin-like protein 20 isoform X1 [Prosopis cineraria]|uniref:formin-like protein 20 isoform X1 n=1 Tax=Prosopis cineraria TaxID=364024 RepID=UPI00240F86FA|nr:formin-like protein 20 isoform X1 [Prosopis cineraria]